MLNKIIVISFIALSILSVIGIIGMMFGIIFSPPFATIWFICFLTFIFSMINLGE